MLVFLLYNILVFLGLVFCVMIMFLNFLVVDLLFSVFLSFVLFVLVDGVLLLRNNSCLF